MVPPRISYNRIDKAKISGRAKNCPDGVAREHGWKLDEQCHRR